MGVRPAGAGSPRWPHGGRSGGGRSNAVSRVGPSAGDRRPLLTPTGPVTSAGSPPRVSSGRRPMPRPTTGSIGRLALRGRCLVTRGDGSNGESGSRQTASTGNRKPGDPVAGRPAGQWDQKPSRERQAKRGSYPTRSHVTGPVNPGSGLNRPRCIDRPRGTVTMIGQIVTQNGQVAGPPVILADNAM
jgi:hypothetical protein